jgi:hypothetical protein
MLLQIYMIKILRLLQLKTAALMPMVKELGVLIKSLKLVN